MIFEYLKYMEFILVSRGCSHELMDRNGLVELPTFLMVIHYWKLVCKVDVYDILHGYYYLLRQGHKW
jgi:hypothetical protein